MSDRFRDQLQDALSPAYTIEREITGGGMSRVYVATERSLGRTVVVKVLRPDLAAGVNRERFRREIMLAAQLQHPHVVPLLSAGEHGELLWYTMPFIEGESLREALARRGKFPAREVMRVLHDVLDALSYAHNRGVIHRDIKPGNILRHGSHSLITDFGVAKALSAAMPHSGTTSVGVAIGTPAYMAPEQLAADPSADHRMDLYAVGLLAYELLTGEQPFSGLSPQATMAAQLTRMPTPVEEAEPATPQPLAALVMCLLAKHPPERPATAAAALEQLESFMTPHGGISSASSPSIATSGSAPAWTPTSTPPTAAGGQSTPPGPPTPDPDVPAPAGDARAPATMGPGAGGSARRLALAGAAVAVLGALGVVLARGRDDSPPRTSVAVADSARGGAAGATAGSSTQPAPTAAVPGAAAPAASAAPGAAPGSTPATTSRSPVRLTRDDSLRIAAVVQQRVEQARQADQQRPGPDRDLDSLRRALVSVYRDSAAQLATEAARMAGRVLQGIGTPVDPKRVAVDARGDTSNTRRRVTPAPPPAPVPTGREAPQRVAGRTPAPAAPSAVRPDAARRNRRVALLPVRDATTRPELAPLARAIEDSLRAAITSAGYTLAADAELVRLLADNDMSAQRRTADASGIGAIVSGLITVRGEEIVAQAIVLDVWRGAPQSERDETELDDPQGALGVVRDVMRALDRVSWRQRGEPHRVIVFDFDNQTGQDSLAPVAREIAEAVRAAVARRAGSQVVGDSAARATAGTTERRRVGDELLAGALVAGGIYRRGSDSLTVRATVRDMSEERNFPTIEVRTLLTTPKDALPALLERLTADFERINWGPKGTQPPAARTP